MASGRDLGKSDDADDLVDFLRKYLGGIATRHREMRLYVLHKLSNLFCGYMVDRMTEPCDENCQEKRIENHDIDTFTKIIDIISKKRAAKSIFKGVVNAVTSPEMFIEKYCKKPEEENEDACNVTIQHHENYRNLKLLAIYNIYSKKNGKFIHPEITKLFFDKMDTTQTELGSLYVDLLNTDSKEVYEELQLLIAKQNMGGKSLRKTSRKKSTKKRKQKKSKKSRSKKI